MTEIYFLTVLEPGSPWSVAWRVWSLPRPILPCRQQPSCCVLTRSFLFFDASLVSLPPLERTQPNWPHYTFIISLKVSLSKYSHRVYKPPIWPHLITCVKIIFQKMVPFYVNRGWDFNIWILRGHIEPIKVEYQSFLKRYYYIWLWSADPLAVWCFMVYVLCHLLTLPEFRTSKHSLPQGFLKKGFEPL